jgi:hypothetical protein
MKLYNEELSNLYSSLNTGSEIKDDADLRILKRIVKKWDKACGLDSAGFGNSQVTESFKDTG